MSPKSVIKKTLLCYVNLKGVGMTGNILSYTYSAVVCDIIFSSYLLLSWWNLAQRWVIGLILPPTNILTDMLYLSMTNYYQ